MNSRYKGTRDPEKGGVRNEVLFFASMMEYKLRCNDHKPHWRTMGKDDYDWFFDRLLEEVEELREALASGNSADVTLEAADVGNFAMMIADVFSSE